MKSRGRNLRWGDIDITEIELKKLILHFEQSNRAEGKSPKTVSWYEEMLSIFTRYLESSGIIPVLANFYLESVRAFIVHEQNRGLSPYTVQARVRAMKAFSSWLFSLIGTENY